VGKSTNTANITLGAASVAGPVPVTGGTVTLGGHLSTTHATTGNITINTSGLSGSGNLTLADGRALSITQSGNSTYSGVVSGTDVTLSKAGAGALYLQGVHTHSGGTTVSAGYLELSSTGRLTGNVLNNAQLGFNQNADLNFTGVISGSGSVVKYAANALIRNLHGWRISGAVFLSHHGGDCLTTNIRCLRLGQICYNFPPQPGGFHPRGVAVHGRMARRHGGAGVRAAAPQVETM
jgi:autotransporter-associated beta strand protein